MKAKKTLAMVMGDIWLAACLCGCGPHSFEVEYEIRQYFSNASESIVDSHFRYKNEFLVKGSITVEHEDGLVWLAHFKTYTGDGLENWRVWRVYYFPDRPKGSRLKIISVCP